MEKSQAYHELRLYLTRLLPDYSVELITFVMTISGSIPESVWGSNFTLLQVREPHRKALLRDTIVHAIKGPGLHEFLGVRKASIPAGLSATCESNG
eukprot:1690370-Rhodomonas_salina.1